MKKVKRDDAIRVAINKMLEKYNVTYDDMIALENGKINGIDWFIYYTFDSKEETKAFKAWFINFLRKEVTPAYLKYQAEAQYEAFNLMWGLKHNYKE